MAMTPAYTIGSHCLSIAKRQMQQRPA